MTDLRDLVRSSTEPGGTSIAPKGEERVGDVSNVVILPMMDKADEDGAVFHLLPPLPYTYACGKLTTVENTRLLCQYAPPTNTIPPAR